jgi:hypothetical protein
MMTVNPILLTIWAALAVSFLGLLMYRGQLTRYEDDQLFLNDEVNSAEREQQTRIVNRIHKIEPILRICGGAAGLVTACIVGMVVYDAWQRIQ